MTIADIIAQRNVLIPARIALTRLNIRNSREARAWLATRLQPEIVAMPKQHQVFRLREIDLLKAELDQLKHLQAPRP